MLYSRTMSRFLFIFILLQTLSAHVIKNSSRQPTLREMIPEQSSLAPRPSPRNNVGCDAILDSCGPNGGCCDEHDGCYEINKCTAWSWLPGIDSFDCWNCNWNVMKCVVTQNPGPSSCCSQGTCGMDETIREEITLEGYLK